MSSDSETDKEETPTDLSSPDVTTKYKTAADICNECLKCVCEECVDGSDVFELCQKGDELITEKVKNIFNKKEKGRKIEKGVAFPTCVSVNEVCGHFSPLPSESRKLVTGDVVKVDMGCHIDGFIVVGAHTVVVGESEICGRKADVLKAAETAAEAALKSIKPGSTNTSVTHAMNLAATDFNCNCVQAVLSHQMKQYVIDGNRVVISKETAEEKVDEFEFALNEVYGIDVIVSTGEGKTKEGDPRTTLFKRDPEKKYSLKTMIARKFIGEVDKRCAALPFCLRMFDDELFCRRGTQECMRHDLLQPYPVLVEKAGELVAQIKFTVLLLPTGTKKITGLPYTQTIKSECEVKNEELKQILQASMNAKKKKKKVKNQLIKEQQKNMAENESED